MILYFLDALPILEYCAEIMCAIACLAMVLALVEIWGHPDLYERNIRQYNLNIKIFKILVIILCISLTVIILIPSIETILSLSQQSISFT